MKPVVLALMVATSTTPRPLVGLERDLHDALSLTMARAEKAEADLVACEAREFVPPEPVEVTPEWVWPVIGVAAGLVGAAVLVIAVD